MRNLRIVEHDVAPLRRHLEQRCLIKFDDDWSDRFSRKSRAADRKRDHDCNRSKRQKTCCKRPHAAVKMSAV
jgi:hypothetical protein